MEVDKILEGLSQEERLELLERLIQGATGAQEESLSTEDRVERLEKALWGGRWGFGPWRVGRGLRLSRGLGWSGCPCGC